MNAEVDELLTLDYVQLWKVGGVTLPRAAETYASATSLMHITSAYEDSAFSSLADLDVSRLQTSWTQLRDRIQNAVLAATRDRLVRTATGLLDYAVALDDADDANFSAIDAVREELGDTSPSYEAIDPSEVTEAPTSDDPAPEVEWTGDEFVPKEE